MRAILTTTSTTASAATTTTTTTAATEGRRCRLRIHERRNLTTHGGNRGCIEAGALERIEHLRRTRTQQDAVTPLRRGQVGDAPRCGLLIVPDDVVHAGRARAIQVC